MTRRALGFTVLAPLLTAAALLATLPGCGEEPLRARPVARILLVGMDGLDWSVARPLLAAGRMPNLRGLMERGSYGYLASMVPTLSPAIWTTIATGKMVEDHQITHFLDPQSGEVFTSGRRVGRAIWNIADRYGLSTNLFGWFVTWPAEPVRGMVVSGSSASAQVNDNWKPALLPGVEGQVWPLELTDAVLAVAEKAGDLEQLQRLARDKVFGPIPDGLMDEKQQRTYTQTLWSIQSDFTYFEIARKFLRERPADLQMVYFGGTDVVSHRYWREYRPDGFTWAGPPVLDELLGKAVPNYYTWVDEMLGELVAAAGPDTTVIVCSDHGFHAVAQDRPDLAYGNTGNHQDGPPGVIVAAGKGIRKQGGVEAFLKTGSLPIHGNVACVTPTLLALLGIPVGRDMANRADLTLLEGEAAANAKLPPVESHDVGFREAQRDVMPAEMSANFKERFGAIGYMAEPASERSQIVQPPAVPPEDAAALLGRADAAWDAGRKDEARALYQRLRRDWPESPACIANRQRIDERAGG